MIVLDVLIVLALGGLTGLTELVSRYRDAPGDALRQRPGVAYVLINALAAGAAFAVIRALDWRFGLSADASETAVTTLQVLVAGLAAAALFRSSLFTVRVGNEDLGVGPSAVLDTLLRAVDRAVDRRRGIARLEVVNALPTDISFERDAVTLTAYAVGALQNVAESEAEWLGNKGNALRLRDDLSDKVKLRLFALDLMILVGEGGLRSAIAQLVEARDHPLPDAPPAPSQAVQEDRPSDTESLEPTVEEQEDAPLAGDRSDEPVPEPPRPVPVAPSTLSDWALDNRLKDMKRALESSGDVAEVHLELGRAMAVKKWREAANPKALPGRTKVPGLWEASWELKAAVKLRPTFADAQLELGRILTVTGDDDDAATSALEAARRFAETAEVRAAVHYQLAVFHATRDRMTDARQALEEALATEFAALDWWLACAALDVRLNEPDRAIARLQQVVAGVPDYARARILLGLALRAHGDLDGAAAALDRAGDHVDADEVFSRVQDQGLHQRRIGHAQATVRNGDVIAGVEILGPELTIHLPGCNRSPDADPQAEEDMPPQWTDLEAVATRVSEVTLMTYLGEPIVRTQLTHEAIAVS